MDHYQNSKSYFPTTPKAISPAYGLMTILTARASSMLNYSLPDDSYVHRSDRVFEENVVTSAWMTRMNQPIHIACFAKSRLAERNTEMKKLTMLLLLLAAGFNTTIAAQEIQFAGAEHGDLVDFEKAGP